MLHARVISPEGGETGFADMRAARNALPLKRKQVARELVCKHSTTYSRAKIGLQNFLRTKWLAALPCRSVGCAGIRAPDACRCSYPRISAASWGGPRARRCGWLLDRRKY